MPFTDVPDCLFPAETPRYSLYVLNRSTSPIAPNSTRQGYHEYRPPKGSCEGCPYARKRDRVLRISVHQNVYDRLHSQRLSPRGKVLRSVRPSTVERSFAESKELHRFRFARYRGVQKVTIQVLMTAILQNLKKRTKLRLLRESGIDLSY